MKKNRFQGDYPKDWPQIAKAAKDAAKWHCIRCGHPNDRETGHLLTVHHLDGDKSNCEWHNLAALCQRCHLQIQAKVIIERVWMFEHSLWFRPYVAGYYASINNLPTDRSWVDAHINALIDLGQGRISKFSIALNEREN